MYECEDCLRTNQHDRATLDFPVVRVLIYSLFPGIDSLFFSSLYGYFFPIWVLVPYMGIGSLYGYWFPIWVLLV